MSKPRKTDEDGLTLVDRRVADEYLIDFNAGRAGLAAGLEPNSASKSALRILKKEPVKRYLETRIRERMERTQLTQDEVVQAFRQIAFSPSSSESARLRALENLGKHLGMYAPLRVPQAPAPTDRRIADMTDDDLDRETERLIRELRQEGEASAPPSDKAGKGTARAGRAVRNVRSQ